MNEFFNLLPKILHDVLLSALEVAQSVSIFIGDLFGRSLLWLEIISALISLFFLWAIIYCIVGSRYHILRIEDYMDYLGFGDLTRRRSLKGWKQILKRVESDDLGQWKMAVLEADMILDEIVRASGYIGDNVTERLKKITKDVLPMIEELREAHKVADRISKEPDALFAKEDILAVIDVYKRAFVEFNLLDE